MILHIAHHAVPAHWRKVSAQGDDSFLCAASESDLAKGDCPIDALGLEAGELGTLLKITGPVTPHSDDYIGRLPQEEPQDGQTQNDLSVFWLTKLTKRAGSSGEFWLQCGNDYAQLREGDFVVFPHSMAHAVITMAKWEGISWQLGSYRNVPGIEMLPAKLPSPKSFRLD